MVYLLHHRQPFETGPRIKQLDGDIRAVRLIDETPEPGLFITTGHAILQAGRALDPTYLPTTFQMGGPRAITDFFKHKGLTPVSPRFKELIEDLEPGVHQFLPLKIVGRKREHLSDHWIWVICNRIDSVDRAETTLILWKNVLWRPLSDLPDSDIPAGADPSLPSKVVFNSAQAAGYHFWRDKYLLPGEIYCSDEAATRIEGAGLTGIELSKALTV